MTQVNVKKFEQLKETCKERYVVREQRAILTLNFCVSALEKLEGWAVFAIFPTDEQDGEKYISFVRQRFVCVAAQLDKFKEALRRSSGIKEHDSFLANHDDSDKDSLLSLKERVSKMSKHFLNEGRATRDLVFQRFQTYRNEMNTLFQWCFSTLNELGTVLDDPMADELYFMVKGKISRILSDAGAFEEAAEDVEKNMSKTTPEQPADSSIEHSSIKQEPDLTRSLTYKTLHRFNDITPLRSTSSNPLSKSMQSSQSSLISNTQTNSDDTVSCGSTPEPPFSPRPEILWSHPKINKDRRMSAASRSKSERLLNSW